ncbi:hypothetical protein Bca52824_078924 [Brassica carinata]|uniref:Uncharacterized protein n=1 Tax=Brassica carinata TaxID=52824 RepID=A0A8X7PYV6_BRACI|nr:hypothetical protein Bca52824_078924 [Brassica carinata]
MDGQRLRQNHIGVLSGSKNNLWSSVLFRENFSEESQVNVTLKVSSVEWRKEAKGSLWWIFCFIRELLQWLQLYSNMPWLKIEAVTINSERWSYV